MASQVPFKKNTAASVGLVLYKNDGTLIANPGTITAKISKDFGDYADIGTVTEEDSTYGQIKLALTNTEMNADVIMLHVVDNTSGCVPFTATIYTGANLIDDVAAAIPTANANADALLKRDLDQVEGTAPVHSIAHMGLQFVAGVADTGDGYATTYKTDGTTPFAKRPITTDSGLLPIETVGTSVTP